MKLYVKVLGFNPTDIETLLILGYISVSLEMFDDAEVLYNRVLELESWNMDARKGLDQLGKGKMLEAGGQVFEDRYQRTFRI
jgi:cytochrome c-type biogenesis protein CcmH/NrfG